MSGRDVTAPRALGWLIIATVVVAMVAIYVVIEAMGGVA